jgi:hypothetical protein
MISHMLNLQSAFGNLTHSRSDMNIIMFTTVKSYMNHQYLISSKMLIFYETIFADIKA